jgi:uridine phosphorylase
MNINSVSATELMLHTDGSIYHLHLHPEDLADTVILVGDPDRVEVVSQFFDSVEVKKRNREFVTHTGMYNGHRISVIATGIGSGSIDIVINEIDALANIDFTTRQVRSDIKKLTIVRFGTCGGMQDDIAVGSIISSAVALGTDGVLNDYVYHNTDVEQQLLASIKSILPGNLGGDGMYVSSASKHLIDSFSSMARAGYTLTCPGFYAAQQRVLRAELKVNDWLTDLSKVQINNMSFVSLEMETALLYGLANVFGHDCCSLSLVVGNRITQEVLPDYKNAMLRFIEMSLKRITIS